MTKYVKKRIPVEARHWNPGRENYWTLWHELRDFTNGYLQRTSALDTEDGVTLYEVYDELHDTWVKFMEEDWIVKGVRGEFYPVESSVFEETYEEYDDTV